MLTFLTIENKEPKGLLPLRYKIISELKSAGGVDVKHIRYIRKRGRVRWDKIEKIAGDEKSRLLVSENTELPKESNLMRFDCTALKSRLCINFAAEVLKSLKNKAKVKVAVFDPEASIVDAMDMLLKFTESINVVTRMTGIYSAQAERILNESGAVLSVSKRLKSLEGAELLIVPNKLGVMLPVKKSAVILTVMPPSVSQRCGVYYKYYFSLCDELLRLLPQGFDAECLASALYTLCGRIDLGATVPQAVKGEGMAHTLVSMSKYLINIGSNT